MPENIHSTGKMTVRDWCRKYEIPEMVFISKIMQHENENRKLIHKMFFFGAQDMTKFLDTEQYEDDLNKFYAHLISLE